MENIVSQANLNAPIMDDYLLQKKFEILIELNNKKLLAELNAMKGMIDKLNADISELRRNLHERPVQRAEPSIVIETKKTEPVVMSSSNLSNGRREDAPKPRYGDYEPKDVSIDKFFYFGKR